MGASVLSFVQMILFSLVTGALVPVTFGSGLKMALGVSFGFLVSCIGWYGLHRVVGVGNGEGTVSHAKEETAATQK
jgi:hypothetical protein